MARRLPNQGMRARRKRWEAYTGVVQTDARSTIESALNAIGQPYQVEKARPNVMYDSTHKTVVVTTADLTLSLLWVTADPMSRFVFSLFGTANKIPPITLVSTSYTEPGRPLLVHLMGELSRRSTNPVWEIGHNPRFRRAVGLRLINKSKWERMINDVSSIRTKESQ